ncbi:MAG: quinoprotein relay system zinc metallohydrolase 1 [Roseovarius sp.]
MTRRAPSRRQVLLGGVAIAAASSLVRPARAASSYALNPFEVAGGVWMIEGAQESLDAANGGAICNIVLLETDAGAVIVDTGSTARFGAALRAFADQRLGGVAAVFNTHHHPDHWLGNQAFADRPIKALADSKAAAEANGPDYATALYAILGNWMTGTAPHPPAQAVAPGPVVIGGRALRLIEEAGHTGADLAILDEETGTLVAGDLLFLDRAPSFPDADIAAWKRALERLADLNPAGAVPGHGPLDRTGAALAQTRAYLEGFEDRMKRAAARGLSPMEAILAGPMPEFAAMGANPEEYHRSVVQRWTDYESEALPVVGGA